MHATREQPLRKQSVHEHPAKSGIALAFEAFGDRLAELHLHDNHGVRDEHCWPGEGTVDWSEVTTQIAQLKSPLTGVLEIAYEPTPTPAQATTKALAAWKMLSTSSAARTE